jgi:hypothetical protein
VDVGDYSVRGYWWLLMVIILVAVGDYSVHGYWWLLMVIILIAIGEYSIMDSGGY